MIEIVRYTQRNVKRWQDRHAQALDRPGMLVAEQQFRRITGYSDLAKVVIAIERHAIHIAPRDQHPQEVAQPVTV